jgi:ABC-2 type transport system permease protein
VTRAGVAGVYRAERRKLVAQLSTRVLALVCLLGPLAFGLILREQSGVPADTLLGVWVHGSGYAVSFVVLGFAGYLGFPVLAGALAGDLFSSEDRYGTWKTVLSRSSSRAEVFAGKVLAAATLALALLGFAAVSSLVAGLAFTGDQALVGFSGNVLSSGECLWLVLASWLVSIPPLLAFTSLALLISIVARNGIVGVLGPILVALAMQLLALIGSGTWVHLLLLASAFDDWHGLLASPSFLGPLLVGTLVSIAWAAACLVAGWRVLRARDFAGPPVNRRPGWVMPLRVVLGSAAVIVLLALASSIGPAAVTSARLEASITPAFERLTLLQQAELGRPAAPGVTLDLRSNCGRRSGNSEGPGDDWVCTVTVVVPAPGENPFQLAPITYDVSVRSNGCYKAEAPPAFVGQQLMTDAAHRTVVNPLFTVYGCFDPLGPAHPAVPLAHGAGSGQSVPPARTTPQSQAAREAERKALREAEKAAGPKVIKEIEAAERSERHETEHPEEEESPALRPSK